MKESPDYILFAQHGWADTNEGINQLAVALASPKAEIICPNLGWLKTWLRIKDLIEIVEQNNQEILLKYPDTPWRIIGHSMGGLIWLEVLNQHPEWWSKVEFLVLIASPVGGSDLARMIDPLQIGLGIAKDLGKNRRWMAEKIAKVIPTLSIAGNINYGSDGTIPVESTKFSWGHCICLDQLSHVQLKNDPQLVEVIQSFWQKSPTPVELQENFTTELINRLHSIPGMTDAHQRDFEKAKIYMLFENRVSIRLWQTPMNVLYLFLANHREECLYSGLVGWVHAEELKKSLEEIHQDYYEFVIHGLD